MGKISSSTLQDVQELVKELDAIQGGASCEEVAQNYAQGLYRKFKDSIILARVFLTVPYGELPETNKEFVANLASSAGISSQITEQTPVLSLIGSAGESPQWNDRKKSEGHIGIPLASGHFIGQIPMMSRLLKQLGLELDWIDKWDAKIVSESGLSAFGGTFYVRDARTEKDAKGRNIIAAQDFVAQKGVKTVFGFGGGYMATKSFAVFIVFTCEEIEEDIVQRFQMLVSKFKAASTPLVGSGKVFAG